MCSVALLPSPIIPVPPLLPIVHSVGCVPGTFQFFAEEQLDSSTSLAYPTSAPCPLGHHQPHPSQTECLPCPVGSFTPLLGQVVCQLCPVAEYQDEEGQVVCKACPAGCRTEREGSNSSSLCLCNVSTHFHTSYTHTQDAHNYACTHTCTHALCTQ